MTIKKSFLHIPLYPFLIALAPVISLYTINRLELNALDVFRPSVVYLIVALAAVSVSRVFSNSSRSAAILGCVLLVSALTYEYAFRSVYMLSGLEILNRHFLLIWLVLTGVTYAILVFTLRRTKNSLDVITVIFNVFGIALIALALMPIILDRMTARAPGGRIDSDSSLNSEWLPAHDTDGKTNRRPDVYYIILDSYARGDVLQSRFDFNNASFLDWLETKGFFVGGRSHSNYPWTHLSLSATLNGEYLQTLVPGRVELYAPKEHRSRYQFFTMLISIDYIKTNRVYRFFSSLGYRIFSNNSGYAVTRKPYASVVDAMLGNLSEFERALIDRTIFEPLLSKWRSVEQLRFNKCDSIVDALGQLGAVANQDGPKFVFYHIMSPHPPYCFDENGEMIPRHPVYDVSAWLEDNLAIPGYNDWVMENYPKNIAGLNFHVIEAINSILDQSEGNAVVIIQSDHGSSSGTDLHSTGRTDMVERFGILNAIYMPADFPRYGLEESMSSVNTFRTVLSNIFDLDLPPLQNRAFYSRGDLDFEDVTHRLQEPTITLQAKKQRDHSIDLP
jgi:hypothetical protein